MGSEAKHPYPQHTIARRKPFIFVIPRGSSHPATEIPYFVIPRGFSPEESRFCSIHVAADLSEGRGFQPRRWLPK